MINFRYHIVTLVAVFLALAIGIALGGGPLKGGVDTSLVRELKTRTDSDNARGEQIRRLQAQGAFTKAYAETTAPTLLRDRLRGAGIAIVTLPGANPTTVATVTTLVRTAEGAVVGRYCYGAELDSGDSGDEDLDQVGDRIARAIAARTAQPFDGRAARLLAQLEAADAFSAADRPMRRATGVLVVTGGSRTADQEKVHERQAEVFGRVAARAGSVTVIGPADAARSGGLLTLIRDDVSLAGSMSTVDSASNGAGSVVVLLTLARGLRTGQTGHYGAVRPPDGPMP